MGASRHPDLTPQFPYKSDDPVPCLPNRQTRKKAGLELVNDSCPKELSYLRKFSLGREIDRTIQDCLIRNIPHNRRLDVPGIATVNCIDARLARSRYDYHRTVSAHVPRPFETAGAQRARINVRPIYVP